MVTHGSPPPSPTYPTLDLHTPTSAPSFPSPTLLMLVRPGSPHPLSSPPWFHLQIDSCVAPPSPLSLFPGIFLHPRLPHPTEVFSFCFLNISPFCAVSFLITGNRSDFTSGFLNLAQNPLSGFWTIQKYQLIQTHKPQFLSWLLWAQGRILTFDSRVYRLAIRTLKFNKPGFRFWFYHLLADKLD